MNANTPAPETATESPYATDVVVDEPGSPVLQRLHAERPDDQRDEQRDERTDEQPDRQDLPEQEGAVRPLVDDVERGLEHAEERERRPDEKRRADEAELARVVLDRPDEPHDVLDRRLRERLLDLADEEARLGRLSRERQEGEREERERHEGKQGEVGDHRREMRAPVGEELLDEPSFSPSHRGQYG